MVDGTLQVVNREFTSIGDALEYVDLHFNSNSTETIICFVLNGKK